MIWSVAMPLYHGTQSQCHCTMALSLNATVLWHSVWMPLYHGTQSECHSTKALSLNATVPRHSVWMPQYHGTQPQCNCTKTSSLNAMVPTHSMLMPQHHTPSLTANIILPYVTHFFSFITSWFYYKLNKFIHLCELAKQSGPLKCLTFGF